MPAPALYIKNYGIYISYKLPLHYFFLMHFKLRCCKIRVKLILSEFKKLTVKKCTNSFGGAGNGCEGTRL